MEKLKIGIVGYGNLGKGVKKAVGKQSDMELAGIFSRRELDHELALPIEALETKRDMDVLILCGGSATDLPWQTPKLAGLYHVVDSFDHHQEIPVHFRRVDAAAKAGGKLALVSCGWDPGIFSIMRTLMEAVLSEGETNTFWGKGVSQGHSDAVRRIKGVKDARQYTIPIEDAVKGVIDGAASAMPATRLHRRECFVVAEADADREKIEREIREMPDYFAGYDTVVHFVSQEILDTEHAGFPHGGRVIRRSDDEILQFQLKLRSNPDFTAGVLVAYARAVYRLAQEGQTGCRTVLDIPLSKLQESVFRNI